MLTSSAKAKGRRCAQRVRDILIEELSLSEDSIFVTASGTNGPDLTLTGQARSAFPFAIECKNQERLNIWGSIEQAERNAKDLTPMVIFTRNRSKIYAVIELKALLTEGRF
jgi:hypothetical protein